MLGAIDSLRVTLLSDGGFMDELGEVKLADEGIFLDGHLLPGCLGISWADLAYILRHPMVQQRLEEAELLAPTR